MQVFFSEDHRRHFPQAELHGGEFVTPFERPSRVEFVLARLRMRGFPPVVAPPALDLAPVLRVHDRGYVEFLQTAWRDWAAAGYRGEIIPACFPIRRMQTARPPADIDGKAGYYAFAAETAITAGTWAAAASSCASAQAAQRHVAAGARAAFALCRPPGHHSGIDHFGGYCFLNNAAVAAQMFRDSGAAKVAVLDIDFHHGNGTQDIFYKRGDVFFASIHGRPEDAFPHFLGFGDETGEGDGAGATANFPLPRGADTGQWFAALDEAIAGIRRFGAQALVVSLGVDAYKDDPISFFRLASEDFRLCGRHIAALGLPTVFVLEGGYAIDAIGVNVVNTLEGFLGR
jgi:acetoin utilization deacetylase AcuC-like enzyme